MDVDRFLYLLFCVPCALIEMYISKKKYSSSSSPKTPSKDRGTLILIWLIIIGSHVFSSSYVRLGYGSKIIENKSLKYFFWIPFSTILYFMGHLLRRQSIEQLGKWFTTAVRTDENQQLIDVGCYGKMRHPAYTGSLLYFLSLGLFLNNWLSLLGTMVPITSVFLYRIHVEEQELKKHFGIKYEEYRRKVPNMFIPRIF
jgi:protein-S-isoprenylcysteine O-methyltransferase Ste14